MILLISLIAIVLAVVLYFQQPVFGRNASGERLKKMQQSPHYRSGKFHNTEFTPVLTEGYSMWGVLYNFLFKKHPARRPVNPIPTIQTDLFNLAPDQDLLIWFGHSSYLIQLSGKRFLIDPVFSGNAAPLRGSNRSFKGTDTYAAADMPSIDYLLITHDHYDHLDQKTVIALRSKVGKVICGLGVGAHLEHWGYAPEQIIEKDWNEDVTPEAGLTITTAPARHFSGRTLKRNSTLWLSFILSIGGMKLYLGGDSGYGKHFAEIGARHGPFDLAILDNGQYNMAWRAIHMLPEDVLKATADLQAKRILPVHSLKFALANHSWNEPLEMLTEKNLHQNIPLVTPRIGEIVQLRNDQQQFSPWWRTVE